MLCLIKLWHTIFSFLTLWKCWLIFCPVLWWFPWKEYREIGKQASVLPFPPAGPSRDGTISEDTIRASLISAVSDKLRWRMKEEMDRAQAELNALKRTEEDLKKGHQKLEEMVTRLDQEVVSNSLHNGTVLTVAVAVFCMYYGYPEYCGYESSNDCTHSKHLNIASLQLVKKQSLWLKYWEVDVFRGFFACTFMLGDNVLTPRRTVWVLMLPDSYPEIRIWERSKPW